MRLFFRIVISTSLILLLILKTGQFFYHKYFYFEPNFNLLPVNTLYAVSLNQDEILKLPNLKVQYYFTNLYRFNSKHKFTIKPKLQEVIYAQVKCDNLNSSFVSIFPNLKPSQIEVLSPHKLIERNNHLYVTDSNCDLNFSNEIDLSDQISNVSKSKLGYIFLSKEYASSFLDFTSLDSPVVGSFNMMDQKLILNSFAKHNFQKLNYLSDNLSMQDIDCLNQDNYISIKEPFKFLDINSKINSNKNTKFFKEFQDGVQINLSPNVQICSNNEVYMFKQKADLKTITQTLPDNSKAKYYDLDFSKIFEKQTKEKDLNEIQYTKTLDLNKSLLETSDVFVQFNLSGFKTHNFFNFLSDSFNSVTIFYE